MSAAKRMTVAEGDRLQLMDALSRCVAVMRCCDPAYCALHDEDPTDDEDWDDALGEAEELLDELETTEREQVAARATR